MGGWRRRGGNPDANQKDVLTFARKRLGLRAGNAVVTTGIGYGFPDNVIGFHGMTILVEVKGPDGKLRQSQLDFIATWDGGPVLVVDGPLDLFQQLIDLDKAVPPVRGLPADFRKAVSDALAATAEAVVDSDAESPRPWLATAYVPGPTLSSAVAEHGPLPAPTLLLLVAGIAEWPG